MGEQQQQERRAKDHCLTRSWQTLFQRSFHLQPFFSHLSHVTWHGFLHCLWTYSKFSATRIEISGKKSCLLFYLQIFHTSGFQMHCLCGVWYCSAACWREPQQGHSLAGVGEGQLASQVKGWVKHHHTRGQMGVPCSVRLHQVSTHCGPWSSSHSFADDSCCTLNILLVLSWNFFRAFLLALHWIGSSVQYQPPPFKPRKILEEQPTESFI